MGQIIDSTVDLAYRSNSSSDFQDFFHLQDNINQIPVEELRSQLHTTIENILSDPTLTEEQKIALKLVLDDSISDADDKLASIRTKLSKKGFFYDDIMDWTRDMDIEDIELAYSIITDPHSSFSSFDEIRKEDVYKRQGQVIKCL